MRHKNILALIALSGFVFSTGLQAAQSGGKMTYQELKSNLTAACKADVDKLCSDVSPGEGRIASCMNSKEKQLTPECRSTWVSTKEKLSKRMDKAEVAFRKDCGADVQKFCSEVPSGRGRLLACLGKNQDNLSSSCQKFQAKLDEKLSEFLG